VLRFGGALPILTIALASLAATAAIAAPTDPLNGGDVPAPIRVAADPSHPKGFTKDMIAAITAKDPSMRFVLVDGFGSSRRVRAELTSGGIDLVFGLPKTDEIIGLVRFLDETPLYRVDYQLAARIDDPADPKNFDELRMLDGGPIILSMQGREYTELLKAIPGLIVDDGALSAETNLRKLTQSRGRFFLAGSQLLKYQITKDGLANQVRILPAIFFSGSAYAAMPKSINPQIFEKLKMDLIKLEREGELARIRMKNNFAAIAARPTAK
jgi:hypothetical protein